MEGVTTKKAGEMGVAVERNLRSCYSFGIKVEFSSANAKMFPIIIEVSEFEGHRFFVLFNLNYWVLEF